MDEDCGLLIEGFDSSPFFMTTHNPPYYVDLFEAQGLRKARDLWAYHLEPTQGHVARLAPPRRSRVAANAGAGGPADPEA